MTKSIRAAVRFTLLLVSPALVSVQGCTDLTEKPTSSITPDNFYRNEAEVLGGLAAVYSDLRDDGSLWAYYNLSEISTDEMIVPTRGQDWYDNGRWLEIHRQLWSAGSPAGLDDINRVWVDSFRGVARANVVLDALQRVTVPNEAVVEAELRALRAFYYYMLMDMFGGVQIVTNIEIKPRARNTRAELFQFIETELQAARAVLPATRPAAEHGRFTKGAADAILANMYLNAGVFTKDVGIDALGYNTCLGVQVGGGVDACQAAIDAVDRIVTSGVYSLATNWRSNFTATNASSPENILVVKELNQADLGLNFVMRALHYNQFNPSPWNGFSTLAETYNAFDAADQRRQIFLVGLQNNLETGQPVNDRQGNPLFFNPVINDATAAGEGEGARIVKFPPDPNHVAQNNGNDFVYFRLGEMYLVKAEALNEQGNSGAALVLLNALRDRAFNNDPTKRLAAVDHDVILQERLFELTAEAKRRQDLIRHGKYTRPLATMCGTTNPTPCKQQREPYRVLMPIPQSQMDANPLLVQNAGY